MSNIISSVGDALGFGGSSSVKDSGQAQVAGVRDQINFLKGVEQRSTERLAPFVQLGLDNIEGFGSLLTPEGQMSFLEGNPMFQAAVNNAAQNTKNLAAAGGRAGSGGVVGELFNNYLAQGESFINNQFNRMLAPVQIGQSSAAGSAANSMNIGSQIGNAYSNIGDINAASILGQQNASAALGNNLLGIGGGIASGILTGGLFSDRKYKKNIVKVGEDDNGNLYEFDYIWGGPRMKGRMADELRKIRPDAVAELDGALLVSDEFAPVEVAA